jgi:hypothetical protein
MRFAFRIVAAALIALSAGTIARAGSDVSFEEGLKTLLLSAQSSFADVRDAGHVVQTPGYTEYAVTLSIEGFRKCHLTVPDDGNSGPWVACTAYSGRDDIIARNLYRSLSKRFCTFAVSIGESCEESEDWLTPAIIDIANKATGAHGAKSYAVHTGFSVTSRMNGIMNEYVSYGSWSEGPLGPGRTLPPPTRTVELMVSSASLSPKP